MKSISPKRLSVFFLLLVLFPVSNAVASNQSISSFSKAKKILKNQIYTDHRTTIYCGADFDTYKKVLPLPGFSTTKYKKRSKKIEWEHVVPAENFGRTFQEWRDGDPQCVDRKGKSFRGRNCARKTNVEFRFMEADLHNLYPAIGAVNASRSNYNFTMLPDSESTFGSCDMRIADRKAQPPESARGRIARTYLYMDHSYPRYRMSKQQQKLMTAWDKMYPVSEWECTRAARIKAIQGDENLFVSEHCR
ncbi:MAG: endonuclease I [Proteobacteria bacterium]|nr:endonuclease I [Pseudomonadota bacterium]MCP4368013.1 endonuclease I [Deltaproteobacteria bacterium]